MVENVAKRLFSRNIYPNNSEFKIAAQEYLAKKHEDFFQNFSESRWTSFYGKHIKQSVSLVITFDGTYLHYIINIFYLNS